MAKMYTRAEKMERNRQADEMLRGLTDAQIEWGIKEASERIELALALADPFEDEINNVGHPGREMATTQRGTVQVLRVCHGRAAQYQTALNDLLAEKARRAAARGEV